jgi:hypothetical protein
MKQNTDYGYDVQRLYLEMMLADAATFVRCQSIFDHTLFDRKLQKAAEFMNQYIEDHSIMPTIDIVNAATSSSFKPAENLREEHFDWLLTDFETFIKKKEKYCSEIAKTMIFDKHLLKINNDKNGLRPITSFFKK